MKKNIVIKGAREHNLKNIDVEIPRNKLTVVTGVSGSGKSSLVFDTLFAEGQRRYVESLSAYARQFLGKMNKPEVDYINGISPAIAIEQKVNTRNPRSTVATSTEIYDYLKLLFARIGVTYSPVSNKPIQRYTVDTVVDILTALSDGTKVLLLVAIKEKSKDLVNRLEQYVKNGFSRILVDDEVVEIEEYIALIEKKKLKSAKELFLLIDRFVLENKNDDSDEARNRMADSVQTAFYEGKGECTIHYWHDDSVIHKLNYNNRFEADGIAFEEPSVNFFSFNNPYGACKKCEGFGNIIGIDEDLVLPNKSLSIYEDAVAPWKGEKLSEWKTKFVKLSSKNKFPIHKPYHSLSETQREFLWRGGDNWEGIDGFFKDIESQTYKIQYRVMLSRYRGKTICTECKGTRLRKDTDYVKLVDITKKNVADLKCLSQLLLMSIDEAVQYFSSLTLSETHIKIATRILTEINSRLAFLQNVGLGYLSLNRLSNTLSGGESQRINLATSLGSSLVGSLYILDEPSIGLHSKDTQNLIQVLQQLRDIGNTVVVVEHDQDIMEVADNVIDVGPNAGLLGGELVAEGTVDEIKKNRKSLTGQYLSNNLTIPVPAKRRKWDSYIEVKGARQNNLKGIDVKFPLHTLTVVTGVSGSGKTTLVKNILYPAIQKHLGTYNGEKTGVFDKLEGLINTIHHVELVDQNPIGKSSRSNPVTYIKAYDAIRELYANLPISKSRGYKAQHFSFNVDGGRCETCSGEGEITIEMQFMADIHLPCDECKGKRFKTEVLECTYKEKSISDVLEMNIDEALDFFKEDSSIYNKLYPLHEVGLGYVKLGQSSSTLSGGEAQRVKLASFLGKNKSTGNILFIFDEPTTGLHFNDIKKLMDSFQALINQGNSVLIIEHNMDVIKCADWVIDLGPDAGSNGGNLVFAGTPEDLIHVKESYTGYYLKQKIV